MFNSYSSRNYNTQSMQINAVTGSILKNHPKSWFECFGLDSPRAKALLNEGGHKGGTEYTHYNACSMYLAHDTSTPVHDPEKDIVILQMLICGDMKVIAECVYLKDLETEANLD